MHRPRVAGVRTVPGRFGDGDARRFVKMLVSTGWLPKEAKIAVQLEKMPAPPKPKAPNMRDF